MDSKLAQFLNDRKQALLTQDKPTITQFCQEHRIDIPADDDSFWTQVNRAIATMPDAPMHQRVTSCNWLLDRGQFPYWE
jgi:hypothetical protein